MKTSILTSACLSLLYVFSNTQAKEENEKHLDLLLSDPKYKPNTLGNIIPGRFIIEFDQNFDGSSQEFVNDIESDPDIISRIRMSIAHDYNSNPSIFRGISISLDENIEFPLKKRGQGEESIQNTVLRKILNENRVKHIYPVTEIQRPKVQEGNVVRAYALDDNTDDTIKKIAPKVQLSKNGPELPFSHGMTQVNKVFSDLQLKGKGIVVGIIDSGKNRLFYG